MRDLAGISYHGPEAADCVLVLGAALGPGGRPRGALRRRTLVGAALVASGRARYLVLSGGCPRPGPPEAAVMARIAELAGAPADRVILEDRSTTTFENFACCQALIRRRGWRRVVVVTDAAHMARALMVARWFGLDDAQGHPVPPARHRWRARLREAAARWAYRWGRRLGRYRVRA